MNNRTILFLTILVLCGMGILFLINFEKIFSFHFESHLKTINVKNIEVFYQGKSYSMNFDQQKLFIQYINQATFIDKEIDDKDKSAPAFEKIIVYRIEKESIELTPIAYILDQDILFSVPQWNPNNYLLDISGGKLKSLIENVYLSSK